MSMKHLCILLLFMGLMSVNDQHQDGRKILQKRIAQTDELLHKPLATVVLDSTAKEWLEFLKDCELPFLIKTLPPHFFQIPIDITALDTSPEEVLEDGIKQRKI